MPKENLRWSALDQKTNFITLSRAEETQRPIPDSRIREPGPGAAAQDCETANPARAFLTPPAAPSFPASQHRHRDSVSTAASDSDGGSPTTTTSLMDGQYSQETPGTSPDTPASSQSLSKPSLSTTLQMDFRQHTLNEMTRPTPPSKKGRNLKNLAVDTSTSMSLGRALSTATLPLQQDAQPSAQTGLKTPAFLKPMTPRRKSSGLGLTIMTQADSNKPSQQALAVPPTPSLVRPTSLRHFPSSPSLTILSPSKAPEGGMRLPPLATRRVVNVGFADAPIEQEEEEAQNFDVPQSREEKPEAYPDGPICIYDPHVYLYFEPTATQASEYDVVFNVASEVLNPFTRDIPTAAIPADSNRVSEALKAAQQFPNKSLGGPQKPEYIHIPWEHNTDIVPDLYRLVKVIDERVQQGKRVLIHCQCGVSRSASLIVAYGLYKNPSIAVQEAYDAVKRRSKWIGPNMNLIMQLQEFRSGLIRSNAGVSKSTRKNTLSRPSFNRSQSAQGEQFVRSHSRLPQSAPLPPDVIKTAVPQTETKLVKNEGLLPPGPSTAPSGMMWPQDYNTDNSPSDLTPQSQTPQTNEIAAITVLVPQRTSEEPFAAGIHSYTASQNAIQQVGEQGHNASIADVLHRPRPLSRKTTSPRPQMLQSSALGIASPRSTEFGMKSMFAPALDDAFGLTSPRQTAFAAANALPVSHDSREGALDSVSSPRSEHFSMTSIHTPASEDTYGLTSPQASTFPSSLPLRPASAPRQPETNAKIGLILPPLVVGPEQAQEESQARAELGSAMGMTRRSNYDLKAAFHSGTTHSSSEAAAVPPIPAVPQSVQIVHRPTDSLDSALMSPRSGEFTSNPFHESSAEHGKDIERKTTPRAVDDDPRSPAQKGASPIVRSIFDVL